MRVIHKYSLDSDDISANIMDFIDERNISYEVVSGIAVIQAFEDSDYWPQLHDMMLALKANSLAKPVFTNRELSDSQWLVARSQWRQLYPQPEDNLGYKWITYDGFCQQCGSGLEQKNNFILKTTPRWGTHHFLMVNWVEDELFVSNVAAEELVNQGTRGLFLKDVTNYKSNKPLENIKQLYIDSIKHSSMIIRPNDITKEIACEKCGVKKYVLSGRSKLRFDKRAFKDRQGFVKTNELFGDGLMSANLILISQSVFRVITDKGLGKDLVFEPVELV